MHGGWQLNKAVGPHTLIIGIESSHRRFDELTPFTDKVQGQTMGGMGPQFSDWIEQTLRPMIERRFATPKKVGVLGSSLGGLMAVNHALRQRGRYDFAAGMSATMGWGQLGDPQGQSMYQVASTLTPGREVFYLDSGGGPSGGDNYAAVKRFAEQLASQQFRWDENLHHWHEPGAAHTEAAWRARAFRPISIFES